MLPRIKTLIGELGLRYRPASNADLNEHFAMLALLAVDLADIPPKYLEMAISAWVKSPRGRFIPKAAELIELAQSFLKIAEPLSVGSHCNTPQESCDRNNRRLDERNLYPARAEPRWITDGKNCWLEPVSGLENVGGSWRLKDIVTAG